MVSTRPLIKETAAYYATVNILADIEFLLKQISTNTDNMLKIWCIPSEKSFQAKSLGYFSSEIS